MGRTLSLLHDFYRNIEDLHHIISKTAVDSVELCERPLSCSFAAENVLASIFNFVPLSASRLQTLRDLQDHEANKLRGGASGLAWRIAK